MEHLPRATIHSQINSNYRLLYYSFEAEACNEYLTSIQFENFICKNIVLLRLMIVILQSNHMIFVNNKY